MRIGIKDLEITRELEGEIRHTNYLQYLELAWSRHYEVVISPDIVWYSLLCEVAGIVKGDPETYRHLFSDSDEKQEIVVQSGSLTEMPVERLIAELKRYVPTDVDKFLPVFSESAEGYKLASMVSFADMASPYYNYSMFMCGIPAVHLLGTMEDWVKLQKHWRGVFNVLNLVDVDSGYFNRVDMILDRIIANIVWQEPEFWEDMFKLTRCGSGSENTVSGWITDLFKEMPKLAKSCNFSSHVAQVDYKQLDTGKEYTMKRGLFESKVDGVILRPEFGCTIEEKK